MELTYNGEAVEMFASPKFPPKRRLPQYARFNLNVIRLQQKFGLSGCSVMISMTDDGIKFEMDSEGNDEAIEFSPQSWLRQYFLPEGNNCGA